MSLIGLRAGLGGDEASMKSVSRFFEALARGKLDAAKRLAAKDLEWFGKPLRFDSAALGAWIAAAPLAVGEVRALSPETLGQIPAHAVARCFGGPVGDDDRVVFADVTRGERTTTVIAVVGADAKLRRIVDPAAFVGFAEYAAVLHHVKAPS